MGDSDKPVPHLIGFSWASADTRLRCATPGKLFRRSVLPFALY
jgi:hypothetical protein